MASVEITNWISRANIVIQHFKKEKKPKLKYPTTYRWSCYILGIPIGCAPCFVWSTIWRIVACPGMCLCKGPGFACSDNGCTQLSDRCIANMVNETQSVFKVDKMPNPVTKEDFDALDVFFVDFKALVLRERGLYTHHQYKICEAIFDNTITSCTPYMVMDYIESLQRKFVIN